ncbi:hypothetical protein BGZ59_004164 [Podila verticillata]|nr:hypothetical protein BGZ59_004164 [Podila verticillata]
MFDKKKKPRTPQPQPQRNSNGSSSHALVPPGQHHVPGKHASISMEMLPHQQDPPFTRSQFQNIDIGNSNNFLPSSQLDNQPQIHVHDPLPPPVDFSQVTPTTRYQFRALARRALSYHRRQRSSNICCLVIWPVMLVTFCFIFSLIGDSDTDLGGSSSSFEGVARFCVNEADPQTSPSFRLNKIPKTDGKLLNVAWYPPSFTTTDSTSERNLQPCVRWFNDGYPKRMPYENVTAVATSQPDSYYTPAPFDGWFNLQRTKDNAQKASPGNDRTPALWTLQSYNQTVYYLANPQIAQLLGSPPNVTMSFTSDIWPPVDPSIVFNTTARPGSGLFGAIPVRFASNVKWTQSATGNMSQTSQYTAGPQLIRQNDQESMDKSIQEMLRLLSLQKSTSSEQPYKSMAFGAVTFDQLDITKSNLQITMQFGQPALSDKSASMVGSSITPPGLRQMITLTQMSNALLKTRFGGRFSITQGLRALPYEWDTKSLKGYTLNILSIHLFPFGLSFLLPTFVAILVTEKEDRHRMMMAMNGLNSGSYYLSHYFEFMTMQLILSLFFAATCVAIQSQLFWRTNPGILVMLLIVWAHVQTTMALLLASFFSRTRKASLMIYFFVAITCIMSSVTDKIFKDGTPFAWYIHPSFAFFNILATGIRHASRINGLYPLMFTDFGVGTEMFKCLIMMLGESVLFILLTLYIDAVAPSEYGVQKPWHFPITSWVKNKSAKADLDLESISNNSHLDSVYTNNTGILEGADADVYAEHDRVVQKVYRPEHTPLIIEGLFHRYAGKVEPALKGLYFGLERNTVLGLLGPNGAGKSTLIHLLTGLYSPTAGTAHVAGADIRTNMSKVHAKIGVCPQHDILWGDLTVADHLLFYSRLRGIPPSLEQQAVTFALASVSLTKFRDRPVKGLSGGEKRRVSISIALLGDNEVIFLDEPSTGLDPAVRRIIWDIIQRVKIDRTVVLTTHSMEEADILSDRIAIMTAGRLRCIGTSLHLKDLYGTGFRLDLTSKPGQLEEACQSVQNSVLKGQSFRRIDKFTNSTTFEFDVEAKDANTGGQEADAAGQDQNSTNLSRIFHYLSQPGLFPAIEDWGISQTTLEDVFIKIVTEGDSALAMPTIVQ